MTLDLEALKRLCEQATPGPWESKTRDEPPEQTFVFSLFGVGNNPAVCGLVTKPDAAFIAAARSALPALIAECETLRSQLDLALKAAAPFAEQILPVAMENAALKAECDRLRTLLSTITSRLDNWDWQGLAEDEELQDDRAAALRDAAAIERAVEEYEIERDRSKR